MLESPNDAATSRNLIRVVGGLVLTSIGVCREGFTNFSRESYFLMLKPLLFNQMPLFFLKLPLPRHNKQTIACRVSCRSI